jgi:branched-chain amino acid transport system ATP-binding protein
LSDDNKILKINNIEVKYHEVILVIKGVSIEVPEGGIVALLGANGAGKSTILKAISGLLKHEDGEITDGSIEFVGDRIDRLGPEKIAKMGIVQVCAHEKTRPVDQRGFGDRIPLFPSLEGETQ